MGHSLPNIMIGYVKMSQFLMFCCATTFCEDFLVKKGFHDKWKGVSLILILFKCSTSFFWTTVYALFHGMLFHFFCKFFSVVLYHKSCSLGTQETSWRKINKISPIYCAWKRPTFSLSHICTTFHFQNKMSCLLSTWVMMKSFTKRT